MSKPTKNTSGTGANEAPISRYSYPKDQNLVTRVGEAEQPADSKTILLHDHFKAMIEAKPFVCAGAKTAFHRGTYRMAVYPELGEMATTYQLHCDLSAYVQERPSMEAPFRSFVALFEGPYLADELAFESALWKQLQQLHEIDARTHAWDETTSSDPESDNFSFSIAGTSFFVVGLHPASSRLARKFIVPALVFNAHDQFEALRKSGIFDRIVRTNRSRDMDLQGSINPNLSHFGERPECTQYSGRHVPADWKCPFHPVTGASAPVEDDTK